MFAPRIIPPRVIFRGLGFIRLAMASGTPLLTAYSFGENQLFRGSHLLLGLRLWIVRRLRIGLPIMFGRWGLPYMPMPTKVTFIIGRSVDVGPPNTNPTDVQVQAVLRAYATEMCRLFAAHAYRCLPPAVAARGLRVKWIGHSVVCETGPLTPPSVADTKKHK